MTESSVLSLLQVVVVLLLLIIAIRLIPDKIRKFFLDASLTVLDGLKKFLRQLLG
jgi:hypothetical protein